MAFSMFQSTTSPIAIDFGTASVKLLQIAEGDGTNIVAAAEITIPDAVRGDLNKQLEYLAEVLPGVISRGKFKGKRAVIGVPSGRTYIQHMPVVVPDSSSAEEVIKSELMAQMGCTPDSVIVRHEDLGDLNRNGHQRRELICFAMARDTVMRYIDLLRRQKISVIGVHTETHAMAHAFDHIYRREGDEAITTLLVDLGWAGTTMAITHGSQIHFARHIPVGGRAFDQRIMSEQKCDAETARAQRIGIAAQVTHENARALEGQAILNAATQAQAADAQAGNGGGTAVMNERRGAALPPSVRCTVDGQTGHAMPADLSELLEILPDELMMGVRYHTARYPKRPIHRAIFVGGEARHMWLCEHIVNNLKLPAMLGDPLLRMSSEGAETLGVDLTAPQPGWAVAHGLCLAPTDI